VDFTLTVESQHQRTTVLALISQCDLFKLIQGPLYIQSRAGGSWIRSREERTLPVFKVVEVEGFAKT